MSESTNVSQDTSSSKGSKTLKKLTSSSTWKSPFRSSSGKKNIIKDFKENNSVSQVHVPKKYTVHPHLDRGEEVETTTKSDAKADKVAADSTVDGGAEAIDVTSVDAVKNEPLASSASVKDNESERPLNEAEKKATAALADAKTTSKGAEINGNSEGLVNQNAGDDDIKKQVKENPIELDTVAGAKYVPVEAPNKKVLDSLKDKPKLLNHYQELNGAVNSKNSTSLDGPDKVIDLGSGLHLTQQQLLDIAAKRVAPVIANINEEVEKTQKEDKIVEKKELDASVAKHNAKLNKDFEKHAAKVEKNKAKFDKDIESKHASLDKEIASTISAAEEFDQKTNKQIATTNEDYIERERQAMKQHEVDKETLIKNHEELEATKKQELADAKTNQTKTSEEIEELKSKKSQLNSDNSELSDEIERLTKELTEREKELTTITGKLETEKDTFEKNEKSKKELNAKVADAQKGIEEKKESKSKLATEVGLLGSAVAAYASKLKSLKSDNEKKPQRIAEAKSKYNSWNNEKKQLAEKVALEHEQERLEAREAANTEKIKAELEDEKKRLEKERQQFAEERTRLEKEERELKEQRAKEEREIEEQRQEEEKKIKEFQEKRKAEEKAKLEAEEERQAEEKRVQALKEKKEAEEKAKTNVIETREEEEKRLKALKDKKAVEEKTKAEVEDQRLAEEKKVKDLKATKEAEEKKVAEAQAAKEKKEGEAQKSKEVHTFHHSKPEETTIVGQWPEEKDKKKSADDSSAPFAGHKKAAAVADVQDGSSSNKNRKSSDSEDVGRKKSFSNKLKSVFGKGDKEKNKDDDRNADKTKDNLSKSLNSKAANVSKQPHGKAVAAPADDLVSIYEEISDKEYEQHKNDPDYIEVDADEAQKLLKRNKDLLPLLGKKVN